MKIVTVLGTRPQFIKASVVSKVISQSGVLAEIVIHTGQHFDTNMSELFFAELGMHKPAYHFTICSKNHGDMTGRMLMEVEKVLLEERPDAVLVYGDTNSTLAGALAAAKLKIPIAHVEAGLRSFNRAMPEEINRLLTDQISRWLFTPTDTATQHLIREGYSREQIISVGDVMYDVSLYYGARVNSWQGLMRHLGLKPKNYILATIHRAENTDSFERLSLIVAVLREVSEIFPVVLPLHPRTRDLLEKTGLLNGLVERVQLLEPVGYLDMVQLEKYAALIITDSGGVQKEAFFHRVPCVTLRDETEWVELLEAGWNRLAPPNDQQTVLQAVHDALGSYGNPVSPYGKGDASQRIVQRLIEDLAPQ